MMKWFGRRKTGKLLRIEFPHYESGLHHQKHNMFQFLKYCYHHNRVPVLPVFTLAGIHNNGRPLRSNLTEYYDFSRLTINGEACACAVSASGEARVETLTLSALVQNLFCGDAFRDVPDYPVWLPYQDHILAAAGEIRERLGEYICIHIRRTDRLRETGEATAVERVAMTLSKYPQRIVYVMTDEKDPGYCGALRDANPGKRLYFYFDFMERVVADNFYLFCVENCLMDTAAVRISTFKTPIPTYNDNLSDEFGWS